MRVYLDHALRPPLRAAAREAMVELDSVILGDVRALHRAGRRSAQIREDARKEVAAVLGVREQPGVVFCSSFAEAVFSALDAATLGRKNASGIALSAVVSPWLRAAVLRWAAWCGHRVLDVGCAPDGSVDAQKWREVLAAGDVAVCVCASAASEVGTLQDVSAIKNELKDVKILCDVSQTFCWITVCGLGSAADLLVGGARWCGAGEATGFFTPCGKLPDHLIEAENARELAALAAVAKEWQEQGALFEGRLRELGTFFREALWAAVPDMEVIPLGKVACVPQGLCVRFPGVEAEALSLVCDLRGVEFSSAPGCVLEARRESRVLSAMGFGGLISREALVFSWGIETTREELNFAAGVIAGAVKKIRAMNG